MVCSSMTAMQHIPFHQCNKSIGGKRTHNPGVCVRVREAPWGHVAAAGLLSLVLSIVALGNKLCVVEILFRTVYMHCF